MTYPLTRRLFDLQPSLTEAPARVLGLTLDGGVVLDQTVFHPAIEDQPGDIGWLRTDLGVALRITHTRTLDAQPGVIVHIPESPAPFAVGDTVIAQIDWVRRLRHMRMHTALHLLCAAVQAPVSGSEISANHGEVDFDLPAGALDADGVMGQLDQLIAQDLPVSAHWLDEDGMPSERVVRLGGAYPLPCNGLHVQRTGQIGQLFCSGISYEGAHHLRVNLVFEDEIDE